MTTLSLNSYFVFPPNPLVSEKFKMAYRNYKSLLQFEEKYGVQQQKVGLFKIGQLKKVLLNVLLKCTPHVFSMKNTKKRYLIYTVVSRRVKNGLFYNSKTI